MPLRIGAAQGSGRAHRGSSRARPGGTSLPWGRARVPADVVGRARMQAVEPMLWSSSRGQPESVTGVEQIG